MKKPLNSYRVTKTVRASSLREAIKNEPKTPPEDIELLRDTPPAINTHAIGFEMQAHDCYEE